MQKRLQAAQFLILKKKTNKGIPKIQGIRKATCKLFTQMRMNYFAKLQNVETLIDANKPNIISISETKLNQEPTKASRFFLNRNKKGLIVATVYMPTHASERSQERSY